MLHNNRHSHHLTKAAANLYKTKKLLDLDDPSKVLYRTKDWILQPEHKYEKNGCYHGKGVVFPCGKVVIGDTLFVYYGAEDKYVGLATCPLHELIDYLLTCPCGN